MVRIKPFRKCPFPVPRVLSAMRERTGVGKDWLRETVDTACEDDQPTTRELQRRGPFHLQSRRVLIQGESNGCCNHPIPSTRR